MIVAHWLDIVSASPAELVAIHIDACRCCHGEHHAYHWRTQEEFDTALAKYDQRRAGKENHYAPPAPNDLGGYGFRASAEPHPDCPMCDGRGITQVVVKDTRRLTPQARRLLAGVKQTRHGIEVKTLDSLVALEGLARFAGVYKAHNEQKDGVDRLIADFITLIKMRSSKAPIVADPAD